MSAKWLNDAVFYEIYPQSFYDSNGDGIGDLNGIREKLDYIRGLGCNALWIHPCYDSPFKDAGYDVRDYKRIAPRYGTNEDMIRLFDAAHEKGIRVLLDLVPGHTSDEHPWFLESRKARRNAYSDRYIWTNGWLEGAQGMPFISGECERDGAYIPSFFKCQPALNYGFLNPSEPWQLPANHPAALKTREAIKDVMRFWLSRGCDGFRADMAESLVKNDDADRSGTSAVWRDIRRMLDLEFPDAVMVSEWGRPRLSLRAGFDMDFYLNWRGNGYSTLLRDYENHENADYSYFKKDGGGSINRFLDEYLRMLEDTRGQGYLSLITGNHDTIRLRHTLDETELKLAYAFLFTLPGVPFLYYGDEIGMRYLNLPTKEGGYTRTGSRTPMQWSQGPNLGFSTCEKEDLYLPVDESADAPTVAAQENDPDSLLSTLRAVLALRHREKGLQADGIFQVICSEPGKPFVYRRGELILALNTTGEALSVSAKLGEIQRIFQLGIVQYDGHLLSIMPQSFAIMKCTGP